MLRGISFVRHKFFIALDCLLVFIITAGLFGCAPPTQSTYEIIVTLSPICTPEAPLVNVYRAAPQTWANAIFEIAFPSYIPTPVPPNPSPYNEQQILNARYAAFQQLITETKRWSDTETVKLEDSSEVNITLTYISPELFQAVFLNDVLRNHYPTYGFQDQLQRALNIIAAREELLFLLTVTNDNVNLTRHTLKIPIQSMFMHNAENLTISPSHDDHNLDLLMDASAGPIYGYLAYPLAQVSANKCKWVLDPKYNTNIVIAISSIEVDGTNNGSPVSWTIPYAPLINPIVPTNTPVSFVPPEYTDPNLNPMTPLTAPPIGMSRANNWQDFARFIWGQITQVNH